MSWRMLYPYIFLIACVDGFFSNWLYPEKFPLLFKDLFILIVYFLFVAQEGRARWLAQLRNEVGPGVWYVGALFMGLGIAQIFQTPKFEVGLLGFKVMFFYWFLIILSYAYIDSYARVEYLLKKIVYFSIPLSLFGFYQFWADPNFMINHFGDGFQRAVMLAHIDSNVDSFLRVFSTFASSGQFATFLVVNGTFIFALLFSSRNQVNKIIMQVCFGINTLALLTTGSRGSLLVMLGVSVVFMFLCKRVTKAISIVILFGVIFYFAFNFFGKGIIARFETIKDAEMIKDRTVVATPDILMMYYNEYPMGRGMGTGAGATRYLLTEEWDEQPALIENYPSKLQYELGIAGVILFYLALAQLFRRILKKAWFFGRLHGDSVIAAISSYCLILFVHSIFFVIDPPPVGLFLWAMVGMVLRLAKLKDEEWEKGQSISVRDSTGRFP